MSKKGVVESIYPLSPLQQGILFHTLYAPASGIYVEQMSCDFRGDLDIPAFLSAWQEVLDRHPVLRTAFNWEDRAEPFQVVYRQVRLPCEQYDWRALTPDEQQARLAVYYASDRQRSFKLTHPPLLRLALFHLAPDAYHFMWSHHHLLLDGWSIPLVLRHVFAVYEALCRGQEPPQAQARPYRDYIAWLQQQDFTRSEAFWRQMLQGFTSPTPLGVDRPAQPGASVARAAEQQIELADASSAALQAFARRHRLTLTTLVEGAWALLLGRYSGEDEVVFGITVAGRPPELTGVETMVGLFINTLPLRVRLTPSTPLLDWLLSLQAQLVELRQYEHTPLVKIQGWSDVPRGVPFFESLLVVKNYPVEAAILEQVMRAGPAIEELHVVEQSNYPLTLGVTPGPELMLKVSYDVSRFDGATIARMAAHFTMLLEGFLEHPARRLDDLPMLTAGERRQMLVDWNATSSSYLRGRPVDQVFAAQAALAPDAVAVVASAGDEGQAEDRHLSYGELDQRANQLARHLRRLGVRSETRVGLCIERSLDLVVGLLGTLKAGGAYVPLDPAYPPERLRFMLADAQVAVLLTQKSIYDLRFTIYDLEESASAIVNRKSKIVNLDADWPTVARESGAPFASGATADNLAYVIYTSGSTGLPKGVAVPHRGLLNLLYWHLRTYDLSAADRVTHLAGLGFDASVWELWPALAAGARLALPDDHTRVVPDRLRDWLVDQAITICFLPTPLAEAVLALEWPRVTALRCLLTGGDQLRRYPAPSLLFTFVNHYGPTEYSVVTTAAVVPAQPQPQVPPIGRPIANTHVYVLDRHMQPVPVNVPGELYLGGDGLARGYFNRPDLTAERFVPNPFAGGMGDGGWGMEDSPPIPACPLRYACPPSPIPRLYRTGDLVRWRVEGTLEFLGRLDHQVKIRGFRIELGEIEAVLSQHPAIRESVVLMREDTPGVKRLVAYVVPKIEDRGLKIEDSGSSAPEPLSSILYPLSSELRGFLQERLPDYMVPAAFVVLDSLPLTPNHKVNRRALPAPERSTPASEETFAAPRIPAEATLVEIWSAVLGRPHIGIHDNFFALGGDSILSIQIIARAHAAGLHLTPKHLFQHQTIAELAQVAGSAPQPQAIQAPVSGPVPLTPIQYWFFAQDLPDPQHFNQALLLQVRQRLDQALLARALRALVQHHDALRLRFTLAAGGWQQRNTAAEPARLLSVIDLAALSAAEQAGAISAVAAGMQPTLDLAQGPLLRVVVMECGPAQPQRLLLIIHHLMVDGVSWRILLEDVQQAYQQLQQGQDVALPAKTTAYQQWAEVLAHYAQRPTVLAELPYWEGLARHSFTRLPRDVQHGTNTVESAQTVMVALDRAATQALLHNVPRVYQTQIDDVLLTALLQSMASWTGAPRLLLDLENHGREDLSAEVDLTRTVGWFTTIHPVMLEFEPAAGPGAALKAIKEQLRAVPRRGIGYGVLRYLRAEKPEGAALRALPAAEVIFKYQEQLDQSLSSPELFEIAAEASGPAQSPRGLRSYVLAIKSRVVDGQLRLEWEYSAQVHHPATITRLAERFMQMLQALIRHCEEPTAGGYTPSDFPAAHVSQQELDALIARVTHADQPTAEQVQDIYALSPLQQGMLFHSLYTPTADTYFQQIGYAIHTRLNVVAFERAWQAILERHPVLRSSFHWDELRAPLQMVHRQVHLPIERYDWRALDPAEQQRELEQLLAADRQRGFDLTSAPALRLALVELAEEHFYLVWSHHHILLDGWSAALVLKEVLALYEAFGEQREIDLGDPYPYRVYIDWLQRQQVSTAEAFWRERFKGFSAPTPLPLGRPGTLDGSADRAEQQLRLLPATSSALLALARQHQITLNTVVQGVWALLLSHYSGEEDVVFGATFSGRPPALVGVESIVGLLINTLPVRVRIGAAESAVTWLQQLQSQQIAMQQYEHSSLVQIRGWMDMPRGTPLFESLVIFENYPMDEALRAQNLRLRITSAHIFDHIYYPLTLVALMDDASLTLRLGYERRRFDGDTIARLLGHMDLLLESFIASPLEPLSALPTLTADERYQVLTQWNATEVIYPAKQAMCLHQLFEAQVARTPDAVALVFQRPTTNDQRPTTNDHRSPPHPLTPSPLHPFTCQHLTYHQLNARANRLAHHLRSLGVGPEVRVGIRMERSLDLLVGVLGILKAGGAYLPLDSTHPREREAFILADARTAVLLTQKSIYDLRFTIYDLEESGSAIVNRKSKIVNQDADWPIIAQQPGHDLALPCDPDNLAYVIYTSGSTGRPKGVQIAHRAVVNFLCTMRDQPGLSQSDVLLAVTTLAFDIAALELFLPLTTGARLVLADHVTATDGVRLAQALDTAAATVMQATPATWRMLVESGWQGRSGLRILCGGEPLPRQLADQLLSRAPQVWNLYGPTETTIWSSTTEVERAEDTIPIGRPIANTQIYLLDRYLRPVPIGVPGELYIGGAGLARGYLGRSDLTAERFIPNPFAEGMGDGGWGMGNGASIPHPPSPIPRLYRTGDVARFRADGAIEFLGRADHQVKLRGFRIELGEIEAALAQWPGVREALVLARGVGADTRLVAYLVTSDKSQVTSSEDLSLVTRHSLLVTELRMFLKERLPDYMVPASFVTLDALPLTPNGKIDRRALPDTEGQRPELSAAYLPPQPGLERSIALIWQAVLEVERVGRHDNFFDLGGHSLLMVHVQSQLCNLIGRPISMIELFTYPTISMLAAHLRQAATLTTLSLETPEQVELRSDSVRQRRELRKKSRSMKIGQEDLDV